MIQIGSLTIPKDDTALVLHCRKTERGLEIITDDGKHFDAAMFRHLRDQRGASITTADPALLSAALGLTPGEQGVKQRS